FMWRLFFTKKPMLTYLQSTVFCSTWMEVYKSNCFVVLRYIIHLEENEDFRLNFLLQFW
ncbi:hypothetical protein ACJX0J_041371, partial [Zea mays]